MMLMRDNNHATDTAWTYGIWHVTSLWITLFLWTHIAGFVCYGPMFTVCVCYWFEYLAYQTHVWLRCHHCSQEILLDIIVSRCRVLYYKHENAAEEGMSNNFPRNWCQCRCKRHPNCKFLVPIWLFSLTYCFVLISIGTTCTCFEVGSLHTKVLVLYLVVGYLLYQILSCLLVWSVQQKGLACFP